jgi:hypothetical protein
MGTPETVAPDVAGPPLFLGETEWKHLLRAVNKHNVIPIVGPGLVTVPDADGRAITLTQWLVPRLAAKLGLGDAGHFASLNQIACEFLLRNGDSRDIYDAVRDVLDGIEFEPSPALCGLASIRDFDLYIAGTFDGLLAKALRLRWLEFAPDHRADPRLIAYHPTKGNDLPRDFASSRGPTVFHILGDYNTYPYFAVWEEDYLEYICGLQGQTDTLENLFRELKTRCLLLLGAPYSDWIVRFLLRVAKQQRLSSTRSDDVIAVGVEHLSDAHLFFVDRKDKKTTRVISGSAIDFVEDLVQRWRAAYGLKATLPEDTPRGSVFISYAHRDSKAALTLAESLAAAQVPVWLDKDRLEVGDNYHRSMEYAVKNSCSFFISLISNATESNPTGYYHQERAWASERAVEGCVFYLPVIVDNTEPGKVGQEPDKFYPLQCTCLPGGQLTVPFLNRMTRLMHDYHTRSRV